MRLLFGCVPGIETGTPLREPDRAIRGHVHIFAEFRNARALSSPDEVAKIPSAACGTAIALVVVNPPGVIALSCVWNSSITQTRLSDPTANVNGCALVSTDKGSGRLAKT